MRVSVVGLGFVGLTTAVCFASKGIKVTGIDTNEDKVKMIKAGKAPFYEAGLTERLKRVLKSKVLQVSTDIGVIAKSDITIISVGTPSNKDGSANLAYLVAASESVGTAIRGKPFHIVAIKSTVPPGTTLQVALPAIEKTSGKRAPKDLGIASNPEFLKEGSAVADTLEPDKVVIGTLDDRTRKTLGLLYRKFYSPRKVTTVETNPQTAELIKYANNSFLATKISFINTVANICQRIPGTDVETVAHAIGLDRRIGPLFLKAGLGYGGSCFPKDVTAMISLSEKHGYSPELLKDTHKINQLQPYKAIELLKEALPEPAGKTIAILGLAFKANTTDTREAVSIKIIEELNNAQATIRAYDPMAMEEAKNSLGDKATFCSSIQDCLAEADACIIATEWPQFKKITPQLLNKHMKKSILIDGRRVTKPGMFIGKVDSYSAIGYGH
jgi:UDPglucose 6-dehydrogenase